MRGNIAQFEILKKKKNCDLISERSVEFWFLPVVLMVRVENRSLLALAHHVQKFGTGC